MNGSAPKGSPLAHARIRAHSAFDVLWQFGHMSRSAAYRWLAERMALPADACHIGQFTEEQCAEVEQHAREYTEP